MSSACFHGQMKLMSDVWIIHCFKLWLYQGLKVILRDALIYKYCVLAAGWPMPALTMTIIVHTLYVFVYL